MPTQRTYYVFDEDNTKVEGMTKADILTAIQTAAQGTTPTGEKNTPTKIREMNKNTEKRIWIGDQAELTADYGENIPNDLFAIVKEHNDTETKAAAIRNSIEELNEDQDDLEQSKLEESATLTAAETTLANMRARIFAIRRRCAAVKPTIAARTQEMAAVKTGLNTANSNLTEANPYLLQYANKVNASTVLWTGSTQIINDDSVQFITVNNINNYEKFVAYLRAYDVQSSESTINVIERQAYYEEDIHGEYITLYTTNAGLTTNKLYKIASNSSNSFSMKTGIGNVQFRNKISSAVGGDKIYLYKIIGIGER